MLVYNFCEDHFREVIPIVHLNSTIKNMMKYMTGDNCDPICKLLQPVNSMSAATIISGLMIFMLLESCKHSCHLTRELLSLI